MGELHDAVQSGRLIGLRALRDRLASDIDQCESMRDLAALSLRLVDVLEQIDQLDPPAEANRPKSGLTEFERRLAEREQSSAKTPRRAAAK